jgi:hypothetical protein
LIKTELEAKIKKEVLKLRLSKKPHRHSERSEESPVFLFNQKIKKRSFGLRPQDDTEK